MGQRWGAPKHIFLIFFCMFNELKSGTKKKFCDSITFPSVHHTQITNHNLADNASNVKL